MRVFVTGGSGFIGGHVIEALVAQGHEVVAMARSKASAGKVRGYGAEPSRCSLGAVAPSAMAGCDAVVHAAAFVEEFGSRQDYFEANVDGTRQLLDAARAAGVKRFVLVGTEAALFDGTDLIDADETHPYPERHRFDYAASKAEAERLVLAASSEGMTTVSVRPCFVWGPRDNSVLPAVERMGKSGSWLWIDGGDKRTSTTHVRNLVHGISLALELGEGGQAYFITDDREQTLRSFIGDYAASAGVVLPDRSVPAVIARVAASLFETLWRGLRLSGTPPLTRLAAALMSANKTVSCARAKRELGYRPVVTLEDGLAELQAEPMPSSMAPS